MIIIIHISYEILSSILSKNRIANYVYCKIDWFKIHWWCKPKVLKIHLPPTKILCHPLIKGHVIWLMLNTVIRRNDDNKIYQGLKLYVIAKQNLAPLMGLNNILLADLFDHIENMFQDTIFFMNFLKLMSTCNLAQVSMFWSLSANFFSTNIW